MDDEMNPFSSTCNLESACKSTVLFFPMETIPRATATHVPAKVAGVQIFELLALVGGVVLTCFLAGREVGFIPTPFAVGRGC